MKKYLLTLLLIFGFTTFASADRVYRYFNYGEESEVNYLNLNGNFNYLVNWANGNVDNTNTSANFNFVEVLSALPVAGTEGRVVFLTTSNTLNFDDGTQWVQAITASTTPVQGNIVYYNGSVWINLAVGTLGNTLRTGGAAANPTWAALNLAGGSAYVTGVLPMLNGGTGSNLTNDPGGILYCGASVLAVLADGTAGKFLQSAGTSAPSWQKVDLAAGTDITGTLAVGNGGTGLTSGDFSRTAGGDLTGTYPAPTIGAGKVTEAMLEVHAASDTQIAKVEGNADITETTYRLMVGMRIQRGGTIRCEIRGTSTGAKARIYKNGVAHGTELTFDNGSIETQSEDLVFSVGDTIELWAKKVTDDFNDAYLKLGSTLTWTPYNSVDYVFFGADISAGAFNANVDGPTTAARYKWGVLMVDRKADTAKIYVDGAWRDTVPDWT